MNFSLGSSSSQSSSQSSSNTARGSSVAAGGNVRISATGAGAESNLLVQGSSISGADVSLSADNQVNLRAARNDYSQSSTNSSKSGAVGFSIGTNGMAVTASASRGRGNSDGVDQTYTHTTVQAGNTLHIQSGADTNIVGATASGRQVTADIAGNLNIASVQDIHTYTAKDRSTGFAVSVPTGAGTGFGVSANASNTNIDSEFRSVTQQSGIHAGDGGFNVAVAGNTDLKGAVITSTDTATAASRNSLTTGSLTTSDIHNEARYSADSMSLGGGYSCGGSNIGKDQDGNAQAGVLQTP